MTAIIVIRKADAIHLLSDGLVRNAGPHMQHPKVFPIPHVNALVGIRGGFGHFSILHSLAVAGPKFDDVTRQLEPIAKGFAQFGEPLLPPVHVRGFDVVLAGLSEDLGFKAYFAGCSSPVGEPYEIWELPNAVAALPGTAGAQEAVEAIIGDAEACDVREAGHRAMGELRVRAEAIKPEWGGDWIGGFTQLTTLSIATGRPIITTEVLGRWGVSAEQAA